MTMSELMTAGLELMLVGMAIVFGFLTLLVFMLRLMSRIARHFDRPLDETAPLGPAPGVAPTAAGAGSVDQGALVAVIGAAVRQYRQDHGPRRP